MPTRVKSIEKPRNLDAEMSILGIAFLNKSALTKICEELYADMFYDEVNRNIFEAIKNFINTTLTSIQTLMQTIWNAIKTFIANTWDAIKTKISTTFEAIKTFITTTLQSIQTTMQNIWNAIKTFIENTVEAIKTSVSQKFEALKSAVTQTIDNLKTSIQNKFNEMKTKYHCTNKAIANYFNKSEQWVYDNYCAVKLLEKEFAGGVIPEEKKKLSAGMIKVSVTKKRKGNAMVCECNGFNVRKSGHSYIINCSQFEAETELNEFIKKHMKSDWVQK